jgi:Zn-dependent protease with chaperone function
VNFFDRQDQARQRTRWLILLFVAAVIAITLAVDAIVVLSFANFGSETEQLVMPDGAWLERNLGLLIWTSVGVLVLIAGASMYRMSRLSGGGSVVARSMGGTEVPPDVSDPQRRQLRNVVEEIAIASGVPVPEIYVLEREGGINAFAAGFGTEDADIAVSRGCLEHLSRVELQGVIAHEFSHIFNGDMRLNIRLMGVLFGILMIGLAGRHILRLGYYGGSRKNGAPLAMVGLGLLIVGFVGVFFARMIQAAVSRQREFLADASAVQFTRDPEGIAGALKKIAAGQSGAMLEAADGEEVGHMLFADGVGRRLFATHPPILDRIRAVEPSFSPRELGDIAAKMALRPDNVEPESTQEQAMGFGGSSVPASSDDFIEAVGNPSWSHVAYAASLLDNLPGTLNDAAHSNRGAVDVVLALLIDRRPAVQERQLALIQSDMGGQHRQRIEQLLNEVRQLDPLHRLPLIELALPTLKRRPKTVLGVYLGVMKKLIRSDGEVDVFEYALSRLVSVYLVQALDPDRQTQTSSISRLRDVRDELITLYSVAAQVGHEDEADARRAFSAGIGTLFPMDSIEYAEHGNWVSDMDEALDRLERLTPIAKEQLIDGLIQTLAHDGQITLDEVELLRAICASIHCPMPPKIKAA